ncbi:MAG: hypothetical protein J6G98_05000 [Bacilli bacterium]|nr:hypothetical protein [Bacilli bacterium]
MNFNQEFIEQLEEIDDYYESMKKNKLACLVIKKIRLEVIKSYLEYMNNNCKHLGLIDDGYFNYKDGELIEDTIDNSKYHKMFCPICKNEIIYENKKLIKN